MSARANIAMATIMACAVTVLSLAWVGVARAGFGVVPGSYVASISSDQAGAAGDVSVAFAFNRHPDPVLTLFPDEDAKTLIVELPAGLVGDPQATPHCAADYLRANLACPIDTQVGVIRYTIVRPVEAPVTMGTPVYNMVPQNGRVAELGFINMYVVNPQIHMLASVRTGSDYGVTTEIPRLAGNVHPIGASVQIWGVPEDHSHDSERGSIVAGGCLNIFGVSTGSCPTGLPPKPFLRNPTQCSTPVSISMTVDSYQHPGDFIVPEVSPPQLMTGCEKLPFAPSISMRPAVAQAGSPSGYTFDLHLPQSESPTEPGTADLKSASVVLPEGVTVSPSAADGLEGCSDAQIALNDASEPTCPEASKVGSVEIKSPLLPGPIDGSVYEGTQTPEQLLRLFIVAKGYGVLVKLPGKVELDSNTGRITTKFENTPQLPFEELVLKLKDGPRAPLSNPRTCGTQTTSATFDSYAGQTVNTTSSFVVSGDGNGAPCAPPQFDPTLVAGSTSPVAGGFSPFQLELRRGDLDSPFSSLSSLSLPPGLLADVASVPVRCSEEEAIEAACPEASRIGSVNVGAGPGPYPFYVTGDVYLMGAFSSLESPFYGDPFGLAVIVHAKAGPLDLGYVVVKTGIQVHSDGSISATSERFPSMLQGIPLQVRDIRVSVDRPHFTLNPTNCSPMSVQAAVTATDGLSAALSNGFEVGECAALKFHPSFKVSVGSHSSRQSGIGLDVKVASTSGQANIHAVKVSLPKKLPSRNSTLKLACQASVFNSNPAACPEGSNVGSATAITPILAVPLTGPAYLVSHGGAAFPDLEVVLQGEGITLILDGHTNIKNGVTTSTFDTVPDAPVTSFELKLPAGPHSILAAIPPNGSLCATNMIMPTILTGQNGLTIKQTTKIGVTGCPKRKTAKRAQRTKGKRKQQGTLARHA